MKARAGERERKKERERERKKESERKREIDVYPSHLFHTVLSLTSTMYQMGLAFRARLC